MISAEDIALFEKFKDANAHAFGGKKKEADVSADEKNQYWRIYREIIEACESALTKHALGGKFFVKPQNYSQERGSRGHRPKDLWCAVRNRDSAAFNEMPQIYIIVSHRGVEVGFAVSIPEDNYYNSDVKSQNRVIIPRIHRKLPVSGSTVDGLDAFVVSSRLWHVNTKTRLVPGDKGFDAFETPRALFNELKGSAITKGRGAICCILTAQDIEREPVDVEALFSKTLAAFSDLLLLCRPSEPDRRAVSEMLTIVEYSNEDSSPEITNDEDARKRKFRNIAIRLGQKKFRTQLLDAYDGRCAISACNIVEALQAAHIKPYRGDHTNHPSNGILLRADLHNLFDLFMLTIDPKTCQVVISENLQKTEYVQYNGKLINLPKRVKMRPAKTSLRWHYQHLV